MQLKLYLNKFLKVDNIEYYTLGALRELRNYYDKFLEMSGGTDPDFPMMNFGEEGQTKFSSGNNKMNISKKDNEMPQDDFFNF